MNTVIFVATLLLLLWPALHLRKRRAVAAPRATALQHATAHRTRAYQETAWLEDVHLPLLRAFPGYFGISMHRHEMSDRQSSCLAALNRTHAACLLTHGLTRLEASAAIGLFHDAEARDLDAARHYGVQAQAGESQTRVRHAVALAKLRRDRPPGWERWCAQGSADAARTEVAGDLRRAEAR